MHYQPRLLFLAGNQKIVSDPAWKQIASSVVRQIQMASDNGDAIAISVEPNEWQDSYGRKIANALEEAYAIDEACICYQDNGKSEQFDVLNAYEEKNILLTGVFQNTDDLMEKIQLLEARMHRIIIPSGAIAFMTEQSENWQAKIADCKTIDIMQDAFSVDA